MPLNEAGAYLVYFFINGIRTAVLIDDKIPCYRNGRPLFAHNKAPKDEQIDYEIWVMLMEKAWAKLHGTYFRSESGLPDFSASHLLGVPSQVYYH